MNIDISFELPDDTSIINWDDRIVKKLRDMGFEIVWIADGSNCRFMANWSDKIEN